MVGHNNWHMNCINRLEETSFDAIVDGIDEIWSADVVDMQAFSKWNKGIKYLLNIIDVFSNWYA